SDRRDCLHVAGPTFSMTTSAPPTAAISFENSDSESKPASAPCSTAHWIFSGEREVTNTRAPRATAINVAADETPPPTPGISTVSPFRRRARSTIRSAVAVTRPNEPATSQLNPAGLGSTFLAGTTTYSAKVPVWCSPRIPNSSHWVISSCRHRSHIPHERDGSMTTSSPTSTPSTPSPTASTTPAPSAPRMWGRCDGAGSPWLTHRSRWLSPVARKSIRTWPGPGSGVSISPSEKASIPVVSVRSHARMATRVTLPTSSDRREDAPMHTTQVKVRFYELDPYDHVNHTN